MDPVSRQVDLLEALEGDIVTMWSGRDPEVGKDGEFDHTGLVTKVYTDENGNVTGYRIANFQNSGLKEFDYNFVDGDPKKTSVNKWVSLRGAYQWDTPDDKSSKNKEQKHTTQKSNRNRQLGNTLDILTDPDLFDAWIAQQRRDADGRNSSISRSQNE